MRQADDACENMTASRPEFRAGDVGAIGLCTLGTIVFGIAPSLALHWFGLMRMVGR